MQSTTRNTLLVLVLVLIGGSVWYLESTRVSSDAGDVDVIDIALDSRSEAIEADISENMPIEHADMDMSEVTITDERRETIRNKERRFESAKEITTPDGFINTPSTGHGQAGPITLSELVGKKVILVDFWTYSCINCQRTTPFLNEWYRKYRDAGLEIVGVHTPEFEFEKDYDNVLEAVEQFGIQFPVVLDNDYSTWHAYRNRYWPRKYLIDIDGFIVYDHIGEGAYAETELKIQELLTERKETLGLDVVIDRSITPLDIGERRVNQPHTPEIYFGALRNSHLGNGPQGTVGTFSFGEPESIQTNVLYLVGDWELTPEFAEARSENASIILKYQASNVFMVAGAPDGAQADILKDGVVVRKIDITDEKLYRLVEDEYGEHILRINFFESGAQIFTFTFG